MYVSMESVRKRSERRRIGRSGKPLVEDVGGDEDEDGVP